MREGQNINSSLSVLGQAAGKTFEDQAQIPGVGAFPFLPRNRHFLFGFSLRTLFWIQMFLMSTLL